MSRTGPAAGLVVELRIGVPMLHAAAQHERGSGDRAADGVLVHQPAGEAAGGAQKRVGRGAQLQVAAPCLRDQRPALLHRGRQRLFREHVLAGAQGRHADVEVRVGHGQIEDQVDILGRQQGIDQFRPDCVFGGALPGQIGGQVGAGAQLDTGGTGRRCAGRSWRCCRTRSHLRQACASASPVARGRHAPSCGRCTEASRRQCCFMHDSAVSRLTAKMYLGQTHHPTKSGDASSRSGSAQQCRMPHQA